jgi:beta-arabinofuranosyltransferase
MFTILNLVFSMPTHCDLVTNLMIFSHNLVPINLPRRLNSGFYFAWSNPITIAAIDLVVKHTSSSNLSEQPSFYDVLCGEGGSNHVGDDRCVEPRTNLTVFFLDRDLFPNGAYKGIWDKQNISSACMNLGCFVLHNN